MAFQDAVFLEMAFASSGDLTETLSGSRLGLGIPSFYKWLDQYQGLEN